MRDSADTIDKNIQLKEKLISKKEEQEKQQENLNIELKNIDNAKQAANIYIADLQAQYAQLDIDIAELVAQQAAQELIQMQNQYFDNEENLETIIDLSEEEIQETIEQIRSENPGADANDIVARAYSMLGANYE